MFSWRTTRQVVQKALWKYRTRKSPDGQNVYLLRIPPVTFRLMDTLVVTSSMKHSYTSNRHLHNLWASCRNYHHHLWNCSDPWFKLPFQLSGSYMLVSHSWSHTLMLFRTWALSPRLGPSPHVLGPEVCPGPVHCVGTYWWVSSKPCDAFFSVPKSCGIEPGNKSTP